MADGQERMERSYTYTYDQFTVFFYDNHVFIGGKEYPVGQCCVDMVNLDAMNQSTTSKVLGSGHILHILL